MLESIKGEVEGCIGSCWRVINLRGWRSYPGATQGSITWHRDGFWRNIHKIMVYLTETGDGLGSTELVLEDGTIVKVSGPSGTFLLFPPDQLTHRGIPPERGPRLMVEFTIAPAFETDTTPFFAGYGARTPLNPWEQHVHLPRLSQA